MNWVVRIALILVVLGALIWLNWDRFAERVVEPVIEKVTLTTESGVNSSESAAPSEEFFAVDRSGEVQRPDTSENAETPVQETDPDAAPVYELQAVPASLDQSDSSVRSVAEEFSPELATWLVPEEQLRKWTTLVNQAADGKMMYRDRPYTLKLSGFAVEKRGEQLFISPENFARYHDSVNLLVGLPADKLVAYYRSWYPLLEKAFAELGLPGSFDEQVDAMLARVLAVQILEQEIELQKPTSVTYKFMDPELEKASQIEKWLWRMGPENARKIQEFAGRLQQALD